MELSHPLTIIHCQLTVIGVSVIELPFSDANGLSFILYILLCVVRRATYPKLIQFNAHNV